MGHTSRPASSGGPAAALPERPAETLQPDRWDRAVPASVAEAEKSGGDGAHAHEAAPAEQSHAGHETTEQKAATLYTCPMHPEITRSKPGTCPICGMQLVEKKQ